GKARRLHLLGDDGDLGARQPVHQRRLACIGRADDGGEARVLVADLGGFGSFGQITPSRFKRATAAAFSASCRERPWARAGSYPVTVASTVKVGAWSEPVRWITA